MRRKGDRGTTPLVFALTSTLLEADALRAEATSALSAMHPDLARPFEMRARVEDVLLDARADDTVLVRNAFGPAWKEPKLEVVTLTAQHPLVLDGWNQAQVDSRTTDAVQALQRREPLPTRRNALIDEFLRRERESRAREGR